MNGNQTSAPGRVQRRRVRGWKMPPNTVYVGRPTKWGNTFLVGPYERQDAIALFRKWLEAHPELVEDARRELRVKDLACWCPLDQPCHADVLLEIANEEVGEQLPEDMELCRRMQPVQARVALRNHFCQQWLKSHRN